MQPLKLRLSAKLMYSALIGCLGLSLYSCTNASEELNSTDPVIHYFSYTGSDLVFEEFEIGESEYQNPIIAGFYPDPSIVRNGDDYFMVHSSFSYFPGIPIFHSRDLVNWNQIGHVLDRPSQLNISNLEMSEGVFAPTINYHDGTFYVLSTVVQGGGNFMVTSEDPLTPGSWSDPIWLPDVQAIDPSIFFDDDGRIYILNNGIADGEPLYEGHRALWIQEYFPETQTTGPDQVIVDGGSDISQEPVWIEAPHLMKIDDVYVLSAAEGGTGPNHSQVVFQADHPLGPYTPYEHNPILTQRHLDPNRPNPIANTGHADMVETQNGEWWAVFLGVRPYQDEHFNTGRETFLLPVSWTEDNWPVILTGDKTVPYVHQKPDLPERKLSSQPTTGNFTITDQFSSADLSDLWMHIRTPQRKWYEIDDRSGKLYMEPRPVALHDRGNPTYIGRRQQHTHGSAEFAADFSRLLPGDEAGLAVFQNDDFYYFLHAAPISGDEVAIRLRQRSEGEETILAEKYEGDLQDIQFRVDFSGASYDFYYTTSDGDWTLAYEGADGTILSSQKAGGFVGASIGIHVYRPNGEL